MFPAGLKWPDHLTPPAAECQALCSLGGMSHSLLSSCISVFECGFVFNLGCPVFFVVNDSDKSLHYPGPHVCLFFTCF